MPVELAVASLLLVLAVVCGGFVGRGLLSRPRLANVHTGMDTGLGMATDQWRSAALHHHAQHRELRQSVAQALVAPGLSAAARTELVAALGANAGVRRPRVDVMA